MLPVKLESQEGHGWCLAERGLGTVYSLSCLRARRDTAGVSRKSGRVGKTWEKIMVAARIIVAIENPKDIIVCSQRPYGSRAVLKFAQSAQLPQTTEYFFPQTTEHTFPTSDGALLP